MIHLHFVRGTLCDLNGKKKKKLNLVILSVGEVVGKECPVTVSEGTNWS